MVAGRPHGGRSGWEGVAGSAAPRQGANWDRQAGAAAAVWRAVQRQLERTRKGDQELGRPGDRVPRNHSASSAACSSAAGCVGRCQRMTSRPAGGWVQAVGALGCHLHSPATTRRYSFMCCGCGGRCHGLTRCLPALSAMVVTTGGASTGSTSNSVTMPAARRAGRWLEACGACVGPPAPVEGAGAGTRARAPPAAGTPSPGGQLASCTRPAAPRWPVVRTKVAAAAATQRPEEVGVVGAVSAQHLALCAHHLDGAHAVGGVAVEPQEVALPTALNVSARSHRGAAWAGGRQQGT